MNLKIIHSAFLLLLLLLMPIASASDVTVETWANTIKIQGDGSADVIIQAAITSNTNPMLGLTIEIPSPKVTLLQDFEHTTSFVGFTTEQKTIAKNTLLTLKFNNSVEVGKTWNGRIGFLAENVAEKTDDTYTINYLLKKPVVTTTKGVATVELTEDALRVQTLMPENYDVTSVSPEPFINIFQFNHIASTWTSNNINIGDTIHLKAEYSDTLGKIVSTNKELSQTETDIKTAAQQGADTTLAKEHWEAAEENLIAQALGEYYKGNQQQSQAFIAEAKKELALAKQALATPQATPKTTDDTPVSEEKETPATSTALVILLLALAGFSLRNRRV